MIKTLKLERGEISLEENKIVINDKAKRDNFSLLLLGSVGIVFGFTSIGSYLKTNDEFLLWSGLFIGVANLVILIFTVFRSNKSKIRLEEIVEVNFRDRFGRKFIDLKLKNRRIRRVINIAPVVTEMNDYFGKKGFHVK